MAFAAIICMVVIIAGAESAQSDPVFVKMINTIKAGVRLASALFGTDQNDVISAVLRKVSDTPEAGSKKESTFNKLISEFLRLLGVDISRIQDYTLDGVILLAHMIEVILMNDSNNRAQRSSSESDFSPFEYVIRQPQVLDLLSHMEDPNIVESVLNESKEKLKTYPAEDVECIPLLVCRMYPFVKGMQRSLRFFMRQAKGECYHGPAACEEELLWERASLEEKIFFFIPSLEEVIKYGHKCRERYPNCLY